MAKVWVGVRDDGYGHRQVVGAFSSEVLAKSVSHVSYAEMFEIDEECERIGCLSVVQSRIQTALDLIAAAPNGDPHSKLQVIKQLLEQARSAD